MYRDWNVNIQYTKSCVVMLLILCVMFWCFAGWSRKTGGFWQWTGWIGGRGLLLCNEGLQGRLLFQLRGGWDVGEIAVLARRLRSTAEALVARHPAGRTLKSHSTASQVAAWHILLLVGHDAVFYVQRCVGRSLPHPLSASDGFHLCIYWCCQHIYVCFWSCEVFLLVPIWNAQIPPVHMWSTLYYPIQYTHWKYGGHMGTFWSQTSILCGKQGD